MEYKIDKEFKQINTWNKQYKFIVSEEVLIDSQIPTNASVQSLIKDVVIPTIKKDEIARTFFQTSSKVIIVLAHWKWKIEYLKIFWRKKDNDGQDIEDFIQNFKKQSNIILFVCNPWGYKIKWEWRNIVFPTKKTSYLNTPFDKNK